jgi:MFS family permease
MALYLMVFMGGTPLGSPFIGWIGEQFGARWTLIGGGGLTIIGVLASIAVFTRGRGMLGRRVAVVRAPVEQPLDSRA